MKKLFLNDKGGIMIMAAAIVVSLVSAVSAVSLLAMVDNSQLQTQFDHDAIQQELLLRSESVRGHLSLEHNRNSYPPDRDVQIDEEGRRTYYKIKSKTENTYVSLILGQPVDLVVAIKSLITCKRGTKSDPLYTSPVSRLSERLIKSQSLAQYQYFTDTDLSENEDGGFEASMVKFWGPDILYGPVHSNSDIYIQCHGGGTNGGWPTFHNKVTTAGIIRVYPSGASASGGAAPVEDIFLGGLEEEAAKIVFTDDASSIRDNGLPLGDNDVDIIYVKMYGSTAEVMYGYHTNIHVQDFEVYSWYPKDEAEATWCINNGGNWFEDSDNVWTNQITVWDTTWVNGGGLSFSGESTYWINHGELWIEGRVSNKVTFGCADTIYITNDIYYTGTEMGHAPDEEGNWNPSDFFGLVSEKSILMRYKHRDPFDPDYPIVANNCDGNVYLYGAYAAMGKGPSTMGIMACHKDGIFTFEYQHGHGSTPNFLGPSPYISQDWTIELHDSGGNGWEGAELDVIVEGTTILSGISCHSSQSSHGFMVDNGDIISINYVPGSNDMDNSYSIYDEDGDVVASSGPPPASMNFQAILPIPQEADDSLYTHIDLHKFIFPPNNFVPEELEGFIIHGGNPVVNTTCGYPFESAGYSNGFPNNNSANYIFPYGTDYPWYNPVWPEPATSIIFERGTVHIWGAIAQRRRGFIHRSGSDDYNHPPGLNEWDMSAYHFDGDHGSSGYNGKDYHYDERMKYVQPPNYPEVYEGWGEESISTFDTKAWFFISPKEW